MFHVRNSQRNIPEMEHPPIIPSARRPIKNDDDDNHRQSSSAFRNHNSMYVPSKPTLESGDVAGHLQRQHRQPHQLYESTRTQTCYQVGKRRGGASSQRSTRDTINNGAARSGRTYPAVTHPGSVQCLRPHTGRHQRLATKEAQGHKVLCLLAGQIGDCHRGLKPHLLSENAWE